MFDHRYEIIRVFHIGIVYHEAGKGVISADRGATIDGRICSVACFYCILQHMNIRRPTGLRRKRDKQDARKKIILAGVGAVFLLLIGVSVFAIKRAEIFAIRTIEISGVPVAYGEQVKNDMEEFYHTHSWTFRFLGAGNILAWDDDSDQFLDANPQFKEVRVQKNYLRRTIRIIIDGREKFGVWCAVEKGAVAAPPANDAVATTTDGAVVGGMPSHECYWFDRDGVLFAKAPYVQSELFNRVHDATGRTLALRDKILPDRLFVNLVKIFALLERAGINTKTVSLDNLALEEVSTDSVSDPTLYFSLHGSPDFALGAIDAIKKGGSWHTLNYVDFRADNRAYYR